MNLPNEALNPAPLLLMIVDDEAPARSRLRDLLADIAPQAPNRVLTEAADGMQALELLATQPVDVILVDIRMPKMSGVELARHLLQLPKPPVVIFVTAYDAYAVQAFELNAVDYLLKPVRAERLLVALQKARHACPVAAQTLAALPQGARTHFSCQERGRLLLVPVADVLYLKADLKYVTARTLEREYLLDESLTALEREFADNFIRLHRSVLVARHAIAGFEKGAGHDGEPQWYTLLRGLDERLPVSRRQWPLVKSFVRHPGV